MEPKEASISLQDDQSAGIQLLLPCIDKNDPIGEKKKALLEERKMKLVFDMNETAENINLDEIIKVARILKLNEMECYFLESDDFGPFSPRNELESLNCIHTIISDLCNKCDKRFDFLLALKHAVVNKIVCLANENKENPMGSSCTREAETKLMAWAKENGAKSKLNIAEFRNCGRGTIAVVDLEVQDIALEIPQSLLICEDTALMSEMGQVMEKAGLAPETFSLLWSMKEKHNMHSKFNPYFAALPQSFDTGLSFGITALTTLDGTLLLEEILQAKEHLRSQYDCLCHSLFTSNKDIFPPNLYTWDAFLWACELWYSNSMKIIFPDGKLKTCLVPIAGLLNHSIYPHVTHYGRVNNKTESLQLHMSRPCKVGQQCFLSYGSLSNSHLITFYGFLLRGNPYDTIPIDIGLPEESDLSGLTQDGRPLSHMVRATWLSNSKLSKYGLPSRLLAVLRAALAEENIETLAIDTRLNIISKENEALVLETILSALKPMLEAVSESIELNSDELCWDVKLAVDYRDDQRQLISSIYDSCSLALQELMIP